MKARCAVIVSTISRFGGEVFIGAPFVLCAMGLFAMGAGCRETPPSSPSAALSSRSASAVKTTIRTDPDYLAAVKQFQSRDVLGAQGTIKALAKRPNLSPADAAFLERQVQLCQDTLAGKAGTTSGKAGTDAVPTTPLTIAAKPSVDCGPRALAVIAKELGVEMNVAALSKVAGTGKEGTTLEGLKKAAQSLGFTAEGVQMDKEALGRLSSPAVAWWEGNHFVAVLKVSESPFTGEVTAQVHDPNQKEIQSVKVQELLAKSGGILLTLKK